MNRAESRRALLVAAVVLLALLALADVMRPDSALRSFFGGDPATRQQEYMDNLRRRGIPIPDRVGFQDSTARSHAGPMTL